LKYALEIPRVASLFPTQSVFLSDVFADARNIAATGRLALISNRTQARRASTTL
jgi:hypothetical protein